MKLTIYLRFRKANFGLMGPRNNSTVMTHITMGIVGTITVKEEATIYVGMMMITSQVRLR